MTCRACKGGRVGGCACDFADETTEPYIFNYARAVAERHAALAARNAPTRYDWPDDPVDPGEGTKS